MADRTDLDALLIGALYGELTPADEARLAAHLESHPADRTALEELTRTRAAVRESRILAYQFEPPHAVSALLIQEASRRAPRVVVDREGESWFQRFVRSFVAHPAMAAAATVVLVLGIAGTLYLRGEDQFAKSEAPPEMMGGAPAQQKEAPTAAVAPAAGSAAPESGAQPAPREADTAGAVSTTPAAPQEAEPSKPQPPGGRDAAEGRADGVGAGFQIGGKAGAEETKKAKGAVVTKLRGIELRRPEPMPKDLKDSDDESALVKPQTEQLRKFNAERAQERNQRAAAPAGGAQSPAAPPPPPAQAAAPAPEPAPPQVIQAPSKTEQSARRAEKPSANTSNALADRSDKAGDTTAEAQATLAWARNKREQVIALVTANNCDAAASAALEIYNRAPEYFNANVVTDRSIKPCLVYVNRQRERLDRSRASKNVNAVDQAPAPRK